MKKPVLAIGILAVTICLQSCSFSQSSKSSSDSGASISESASSPSRSLSESSLDEREKYERDVRDYTAEFTHSASGDLETFRLKLGKLAEKHGITNWEEDTGTYLAIGRGLRKAKLSGTQYEAFKAQLAGNQPGKMKSIDQGYQ